MKRDIRAEKKRLLIHRLPLASKSNPGGRAERLGSFGKPTGEFSRVEQANERDVLVEWDSGGHMRLLKEM